MTLFGVALIAGGIVLLGYACVGWRVRPDSRRGRDWSAIDRIPPAAPHRGFDRLRALPFIRRSALLDETVRIDQDNPSPGPARAERAP